jgi:hypothetical protein
MKEERWLSQSSFVLFRCESYWYETLRRGERDCWRLEKRANQKEVAGEIQQVGFVTSA